MKLRLQSRYLLTIVTLVMLVVVSLSVLLMWQFHQSTDRIRELSSASLHGKLEDKLRDRGQVVSDFLAADITQPLAQLDMAEMYRLLRSAHEIGDIQHAYVYDQDRRIVHDGTRTIDSYGVSVDELSAGNPDPTDSLVIEFDAPVVVGDKTIGGVRLAMSVAPIASETQAMDEGLTALIAQGKRRNWANVAGTTGLFLVLSMIVALLIARGLVLPIRRLAAYASAVGHGNYEEPLAIRRSDELGDLARSLREMSQNLQVTTGEVHYLAYHDSLTRLPNRAQLKQSLRQAIARAKRKQHSVALLFIDLDDFKRVNDTLGHEAGDTLLKEFAVRLRECLRGGDQLEPETDDTPNEMIARLGGDEFTVVLESIRESADAGLVATRILNLLREPYVLGGQEVVIGGSIGVTTYPEDGIDVDTLLRNADVAMYQAKERGKNNFEFYNDSMHRMATERLSLETDLRHAIEYDQMRLLYQPVLDAESNEICGIEAQVRWIHPALGGILPSVFMPLAEQTGYIVDLDEWVINRACADLAQLKQLGHAGFHMGINLTSVHFRDHSISNTILQALETNGLDPQRVVLEINEKTIMRNFARASAILSELRGRGMSVWIDEFGSGHSPLNHLTKMPVNGVKIARDYVGQMTDGDHEKAIISTIVAMAHSLNLVVTAEGVENQDQIDLLRQIKCDFVQGSLFMRPMLLDDLVTYLERSGHDKEQLEQTGTFSMIPLPRPGGKR